MVINIVDLHVPERCEGSQWSVKDYSKLVMLSGLIMLGRAQHAADILHGAEQIPPTATPVLKDRLRRDLILNAGADPWHRDGLLFETISWLVAKLEASADEVISDPHRIATQQGADNLKVRFDPAQRALSMTTVYEYKCTDHARRVFRKDVLSAFADYQSGARDDQLSQITIALLARFNLTTSEQTNVYEKLIIDRPLIFETALTVFPEDFSETKRAKLFKDFETIETSMANRRGHTFPVPDIRAWFNAFATDVWVWIDENV